MKRKSNKYNILVNVDVLGRKKEGGKKVRKKKRRGREKKKQNVEGWVGKEEREEKMKEKGMRVVQFEFWFLPELIFSGVLNFFLKPMFKCGQNICSYQLSKVLATQPVQTDSHFFLVIK